MSLSSTAAPVAEVNPRYALLFGKESCFVMSSVIWSTRLLSRYTEKLLQELVHVPGGR